jgi:arsenate reductase-like glutaredoxin family protein
VEGEVEVQVFGVHNHAGVRKALRFFAERRVKTHFVDFKVRGPALGELKRFADRLGVPALVDRSSKRFAQLGLGPSRYGDAKWLELLMDEPLLLTLPLVRCTNNVTAGLAESVWTKWIDDAK